MEEQKKEQKNKKSKWKGILVIICMLLGGFGLGLLIGSVLGSSSEKPERENLLLWICIMILWLYVSGFLQIVLHEAGHLVFGLLTGYQFSSFRIGSFMWLKENGKLRLKRFSLAGTGGQCLMAPPDLVDGKIPYVLYNLGGPLANVIVSVIPIIVAVIFHENKVLVCAVIVWSVIGLLFAVINGVPFKMEGLNNDGHNALALGKDKEAMRAFWIQMKTNEQMASGKRMKELPEEWFELPTKEGYQNSMIVTIAVFHCNRLMDEGRYQEADELMEQLLSEKTGMVGIHRNLMINDQIFCELIGENRSERFEKLMTAEQKKFMKSMRTTPGILRTEYLYAKYVEKDEKKAAKVMEEFEKVALKYPYPRDLEAEREMLAYAEAKLNPVNE